MKVGYSLFLLVLSTIAPVSLGLQLTLLPSPSSAVRETNIFSDDFASYQLGSFPSSGGWRLVYPGAGNQSQTIVNTGENTTNSLQLLGQQSNSALVKKDLVTDANTFGFEFLMKTDVFGGGTLNVAEAGFYNEALNRFYPKIMFTSNRTVMIEGESRPLASYQPLTWYDVKLIIDKVSGSYNVSIGTPDATVTTKNLPFTDNPSDIKSFALASGWAGSKVYFDNTRVFGLDARASSQDVQSMLAIWLPRVSFAALMPVVLSLLLR